MARVRRAGIFALTYTGISLAVEIALIVVGRFEVPRDNTVIAPVVLTVPPILTAVVCGYRAPIRLALAAVALSLFTMGATAIVTRITGKAVGLVEPIISRSIAGFLAGWLVAGATRRRSSSQNAN